MAPHAIDWISEAGKRPIVDCGQIPADQRRKLDRLAKKGDVVKWRGCWNTGRDYGMGPLKTWFASRALVDAAERRAAAALRRRPMARRATVPGQLELDLAA